MKFPSPTALREAHAASQGSFAKGMNFRGGVKSNYSPLANYANFLHSDRNFFLALPCNFCSSALTEHAFDFALRPAGVDIWSVFAFFCAVAGAASLLAAAVPGAVGAGAVVATPAFGATGVAAGACANAPVILNMPTVTSTVDMMLLLLLLENMEPICLLSA